MSKTMPKLLVILLLAATMAKAESTQTAAELIKQAHKHDNMYTLGPEASQQKALSYYQSALAADPDDQQRLHILYRMAQLYSSAYRKEKGEKPDSHKAISLYKQIIRSYPAEEPLVYKAMSSLCDRYTTLKQYDMAVVWAKKIIEYDTFKAAEEFDKADQKEQRGSLGRKLAKIRGYQKVAVDQVAYSALQIDAITAEIELKIIIENHYGTFIAERAGDRLWDVREAMPELWAPQNDEPFLPSIPGLQANLPMPVVHTESQKAIKVQANASVVIAEKNGSAEPNTVEKPQGNKHLAKEPRAPPPSSLLRFIVISAGVIGLVLAAIIIIKKNFLLKGSEK